MLPFLSFFDELDADDEPDREQRRSRVPGRGGRGPQLQRLLILAGVLLVVLVVGYWQITSCQHQQRVDSYKHFVRDANAVSRDANTVGKRLQDAFLKQNQTAGGLVTAVGTLASSQNAVVRRAQSLRGPGGLAQVAPFLLQAEQLRLVGLQGLSTSLRGAFGAADKKTGAIPNDKVATALLLYYRVLAGDVVFQDSFQRPATDVLKQKNIKNVQLDDSQFVSTPMLALLSSNTFSEKLVSLAGGVTSGGGAPGANAVIGTSIISTVSDGTTLTPNPTTPDIVKAVGNDSDAYVVTVKNGGDVQVSAVPVTVLSGGKAIGTQTIAILDAGQTTSLTFKFNPQYQGVTKLKVEVAPVTGEKNQSNNHNDYQIEYKLAG